MKDLAAFTAYSNRAIKVIFQDKTIVRMMADCKIVRILNRRGDELLFNLEHQNLQQLEYQDYIKVSREFFEHVFLTAEEKQMKESQL